MIRTEEIEPPPEERRKAMRDVVSHCIYGVDLNPLAVELCKVALWIETIDPGKPLGFLDHHVKCGNSLIGATPQLLDKGIPDDAFKPVEGDDKKIATMIRKRNREERRGQKGLFTPVEERPHQKETAEAFKSWDQLPEDAIQQVKEKVARYGELVKDTAYQNEKQVADLWAATFFWSLTDKTESTVPTEDVFRRFQSGGVKLKPDTQDELEKITDRHRFFHWHLEFPEVFAKGNNGGFDCVLGNPPWERIKLQEKEFFAQKEPEIANASNAAVRKKLISKLYENNPELLKDFLEAKRTSECESHFIRNSYKYPLCGRGDINTYSIFAENNRLVLNPIGFIGCIVPSGIATDNTTRKFFQEILESQRLVSLYSFENEAKIFPDVHNETKFCLLTISGGDYKVANTDFIFFARHVSDLSEKHRHFSLTAEEIALLNPNTRTCPIFRSKRDAEIIKGIYSRFPSLVDERKGDNGNPWGISFLRMFDMANDSHLFKKIDQLPAHTESSSDGQH